MKNLNWIDWFAGFVDAEGNFQVYPKKRTLKSGEVSKYNVGLGFHLSLHSRDLELLQKVHDNLNNIGTFYEHKTKEEVRIAVNDRSGLMTLIDIFDTFPLVTIHQHTRYNLLKEFLVNNIKEFNTLEAFYLYKDKCLYNINLGGSAYPKTFSDYESTISNGKFDSWIVGFINGEGCFYLNKGKCNFFIEHTDLQALEIIKKRLSFGPSIVARSPRARDTGKYIKPTYVLIVSSKNDINNLIRFLDEGQVQLAGHKFSQYIDWRTEWIKTKN